MIIPFVQLGKYDFALSDICVICQRPVYRRLHVVKRAYNSFIFVTKGQCRFTFTGGNTTLSAGALAYLPLDSHHLLEILSEQIEFYRIDFKLLIDQKQAVFSQLPLKLTDAVNPECADQIRELEKCCRLEKNTVMQMAKLCCILAYLQRAVAKPYSDKLEPAVCYLQLHISERINCKHLAVLCCMSTTRFYELFRKELGMSPLQYRDKLLMDRASLLLRCGDISVSEIAETLGFNDPSYFSRFFKKYMGCSPKQYATEE